MQIAGFTPAACARTHARALRDTQRIFNNKKQLSTLSKRVVAVLKIRIERLDGAKRFSAPFGPASAALSLRAQACQVRNFENNKPHLMTGSIRPSRDAVSLLLAFDVFPLIFVAICTDIAAPACTTRPDASTPQIAMFDFAMPVLLETRAMRMYSTGGVCVPCLTPSFHSPSYFDPSAHEYTPVRARIQTVSRRRSQLTPRHCPMAHMRCPDGGRTRCGGASQAALHNPAAQR
jgi:hypothetical protein